MAKNRTFGSQNSIVVAYFRVARQLLERPSNLPAGVESPPVYPPSERIAAGIAMVISAFEAFLNAWAIIEVQDHRHPSHDQILKDLRERRGLRDKLKEWPPRLYGDSIELGSGVGQQLLSLIDLRNHLLHCPPTFETVEVSGLTLEGLLNISEFASLQDTDLQAAIAVVEKAIEALHRIAGHNAEQALHGMTYWAGRPIFPDELARARNEDSKL